MMKVLIKQKGKLPFPICLEGMGSHIYEKKRKVGGGAQLVSPACLLQPPRSTWLSFPCLVPPFWSPSITLVNNILITGSRSYPNNSEPVLFLLSDDEEGGKEINAQYSLLKIILHFAMWVGLFIMVHHFRLEA